MSKETSVQDASENPVYSMLENAMLVVDEEEAKKFLGATRLLQLMVDSGDGIGPAHLRHCYDSSHRYYFVSDFSVRPPLTRTFVPSIKRCPADPLHSDSAKRCG